MNSSNVVRPELGQWDGTDGLCNLLPAVFPEIILYLLHYYFLVHSFSFVVVLPLTKARNLGFFSFCGTESKRKHKTRVNHLTKRKAAGNANAYISQLLPDV